VIESIERVRAALGAEPWPSAAEVEAALAGLPVRVSDHLHPGRAFSVELAPPEPLALAVLRDAYGEPNPLPKVHWDQPQVYGFWLPPLPVYATGDPVTRVLVRRDG
jgi:hypothetical protein